jgi:hypothetical protein
MSRLSGQKEFERAALPLETQLSLDVDAEEFISRVRHRHLQPNNRRRYVCLSYPRVSLLPPMNLGSFSRVESLDVRLGLAEFLDA